MSDKPFTTGATPPNIEQLREAVDAMNKMSRPITQIKVIKSVLAERGAPMLLCHPDDFEFIKNAKLS